MSIIKDVAKLAGVSASTVSRAISQRVFVEEETRQKVLQAVEELGYQPNMFAKALKDGRTNTIAFLIPDINSLFYPEVMKSIERYASEKGFSTILCNNNEDIQKEKQTMKMLLNRRVDGILCVSIDNEYGGYLMAKALLERGHVKIAGMFGDFGRQRFRDRYLGCRRAMEEFGIHDYKRYFIYAVDMVEEAYQRTLEMLERDSTRRVNIQE